MARPPQAGIDGLFRVVALLSYSLGVRKPAPLFYELVVAAAGRIGYSATVVAHAELGRRPVSAEFWELADDALAADGKLTAQGIWIRDLAMARREEQHRQDRARHARNLARLLPRPHGQDSTISAAPAAPAPAVTTPAAGRCPHCHQPVTLVTQIAAPPDAGTGQQPDTGGLADSGTAHTARNRLPALLFKNRARRPLRHQPSYGEPLSPNIS